MSFRDLVTSAALVALVTGSAAAVAPPADVNPSIVPNPSQRDRVLDQDLQRRLSAESEALRAFNARYGEWHVAVWSELTGTPGRAFGEPIPLVDGTVDETSAAEAALRFVDENADMFGVSAADLRLKRVHRGRDVFYVQLQQTFGGVDVYDARVIVRIDTDGRLISFGSDTYPQVSASPFARLSVEHAISSAAGGLAYDTSRDAAEHVGRVILPIHGESEIDYVTTHEVLLRVDGQNWLSYVNAETGTIVWREPTTRHVDIVGEITAEVVEEDPFGPTFDGGMWHMNAFMSPASINDFTDEDGSFDIPYGGTDAQTGIATFFTGNQHFNVDENTGNDGVLMEPVTPGVFASLHWDDGNSLQQERVPFYHLQRQREQLLAYDPGFPILVDPIEVETNWSGTCNAQWTGTQVLLFAAGGGCIATGRIPSVVAHEYGHGLSTWQNGGTLQCALIEAYPDIKAMYYTKQPQIGTGFTGPGTLLRDGRNTLTWDAAVATCPTGGYANGECHCKADVTMGAAWKTRVNMVEKYGEAAGALAAQDAIHYAIYSSPTTPQFYVVDVLQEDDDDGNLNNGTPNWNQICDAFDTQHGLPCPEITEYLTIDHTPLGDTVNDSDPYEIVATISATNETLDTGNLFVTYNVSGGAWNMVAMTATGNPDEYQADIPAQGGGEYVEYYITAEGTGGAVAESPEDAPFLDVHRFAIGTFQVSFSDEAESDNGWTLGDPGDTATGGEWVRDDPNGTTQSGQPANPEDDATPTPGTDCYFTGQGTVGGSSVAADIDGGCTTLTSPVLDLSTTTFARISYQRWFYNSSSDGDAMTVQISTDGGTSWTTLEAVDGPNAWTESEHDIVSSQFSMTANTLLRFIACDEGTAGIVEAALDDLSISLLTTDVTDVADAAPIGRFRVEQNRPNPFNPVTNIRYEVVGADHVSIRIYNVTGQLVRTLVDRAVEPGVYNVQWDGTGDAGKAVASGTYYYRVVSGDHESVHAMTLLK